MFLDILPLPLSLSPYALFPSVRNPKICCVRLSWRDKKLRERAGLDADWLCLLVAVFLLVEMTHSFSCI